MDFAAVCFGCRQYVHAGQDMACVQSFGYGSRDYEGQALVAEWVLRHATHHHVVVVVDGNDTPIDFAAIDLDACRAKRLDIIGEQTEVLVHEDYCQCQVCKRKEVAP